MIRINIYNVYIGTPCFIQFNVKDTSQKIANLHVSLNNSEIAFFEDSTIVDTIMPLCFEYYTNPILNYSVKTPVDGENTVSETLMQSGPIFFPLIKNDTVYLEILF